MPVTRPPTLEIEGGGTRSGFSEENRQVEVGDPSAGPPLALSTTGKVLGWGFKIMGKALLRHPDPRVASIREAGDQKKKKRGPGGRVWGTC